jgi:signal peptidase II
MSQKYSIAALSFFVFLAIDQVTKEWVLRNIPYPPRAGDEIKLIPDFLSITHAKNPGAAFSMFDDFAGRMVVFGVFTVIAVVGLAWGLKTVRDDDRMQAFAIGLILSGAIGNAIDRIRFQMVTDMVKVYAGFEPLRTWCLENFKTYVYPIWNVADAAILVGVALFGLQYLFERDKPLVGVDTGRAPDSV